MKKILISIASAVSALALSSCFQYEMTITLNKDGSGTVVEETLMGGAMLAMISQLAEGFGAEEGEVDDPVADLLSEENAKERAKELGEGVTLVKIEPIEKNGSKGAKITYAFKDINKLNADLDSGINSIGDEMEEEEGDDKGNQIDFHYKDGKLTVKMPKPDMGDGDEESEMPGAQEMAMMKQMFADMKMGFKLVIAPGIAETNATHRDGDTITLMEMDFGKLVEDPANFEKLAATQNAADPIAAMASLKDVDGVKVEIQPEFTVTLK